MREMTLYPEGNDAISLDGKFFVRFFMEVVKSPGRLSAGAF